MLSWSAPCERPRYTKPLVKAQKQRCQNHVHRGFWHSAISESAISVTISDNPKEPGPSWSTMASATHSALIAGHPPDPPHRQWLPGSSHELPLGCQTWTYPELLPQSDQCKESGATKDNLKFTSCWLSERPYVNLPAAAQSRCQCFWIHQLSGHALHCPSAPCVIASGQRKKKP